MSTEVTWQTRSTGSAATEALGRRVGQNCRGGEVIELVSDLGGGKTTFVRGLAKGLGSRDVVASPTFTISKVYKADKLTLHHFDFYRLQDGGVVAHELHDVLGDPQAVIAVEWSDIVQHVLPEKRLSVIFKPTGYSKRQLTFNCPVELQYLLEGLK